MDLFIKCNSSWFESIKYCRIIVNMVLCWSNSLIFFEIILTVPCLHMEQELISQNILTDWLNTGKIEDRVWGYRNRDVSRKRLRPFFLKSKWYNPLFGLLSKYTPNNGTNLMEVYDTRNILRRLSEDGLTFLNKIISMSPEQYNNCDPEILNALHMAGCKSYEQYPEPNKTLQEHICERHPLTPMATWDDVEGRLVSICVKCMLELAALFFCNKKWTG